MTRDRDIERVLEAWLLPGSSEMPDRLFDDLVDRIDRVPQRRLLRAQTRFLTMRPALRIAALAAVVVIAVGAGIALLGQQPSSSVGASTPAPSVAPSPSPSPSPVAALPADLAHIWIGAPRPLAGYGVASPALPLLYLDESPINLSVDLGPKSMFADPAIASPEGIRFMSTGSASPCSPFDVGDYTWKVSPDGMTLTLAVTDDACAARAEAYAGTWTRSECKNVDDTCLGDVPAGTYLSTFLDTKADATLVAYRGDYGKLRYTIPDGWANSDDWPSHYTLVPSAEYAKGDGSGFGSSQSIFVGARPEAMLQDAQCTNGPKPGVGRTLAELTAWLAEHPGLDATTPQDIVIGGRPATMIDIAMAADWTQTCPDVPGGAPVVDLFREAREGQPQWNWGIGVDERQRVILVDLGGDCTVVILIDDASSPSRFDELVAQAMPIVESFEFPR